MATYPSYLPIMASPIPLVPQLANGDEAIDPRLIDQSLETTGTVGSTFVVPAVVPATPAANAPAAANNGIAARTKRKAADNDDGPDVDPAPKRQATMAWAPTIKGLVDCPDPLMCPGFNLNCFHAYKTLNGYWDHVKKNHGISRAMLKKPEFAQYSNIFEPHRESWWIARGQDTTYQGNEAKQKNARRRMAMGMNSDHPNYVQDVYYDTPNNRHPPQKLREMERARKERKAAEKEAREQAEKEAENEAEWKLRVE